MDLKVKKVRIILYGANHDVSPSGVFDKGRGRPFPLLRVGH